MYVKKDITNVRGSESAAKVPERNGAQRADTAVATGREAVEGRVTGQPFVGLPFTGLGETFAKLRETLERLRPSWDSAGPADVDA